MCRACALLRECKTRAPPFRNNVLFFFFAPVVVLVDLPLLDTLSCGGRVDWRVWPRRRRAAVFFFFLSSSFRWCRVVSCSRRRSAWKAEERIFSYWRKRCRCCRASRRGSLRRRLAHTLTHTSVREGKKGQTALLISRLVVYPHATTPNLYPLRSFVVCCFFLFIYMVSLPPSTRCRTLWRRFIVFLHCF